MQCIGKILLNELRAIEKSLGEMVAYYLRWGSELTF